MPPEAFPRSNLLTVAARHVRSRWVIPLVDWARFGHNPAAIAAQIAEREYWEPQRLRRWQTQQLRAFLQHCYDHVPFYHRRFNAAAFRPADLEDTSQIERIPPLTKSDIRANVDDLFARNRSRKKTKAGCTGGSTGEPAPYFVSHYEAALRRAITYRFYDWMGLRPGDPVVKLMGLRFSRKWKEVLIKWYFNHGENCRSLPAAALNGASLAGCAAHIEQFQPRAILGYASAIYLLARHLLAHGIRLPSVEVLWSTSEVLYPFQRATIAKAFGVQPFDVYGGGETHIAAECTAHNGMHMVDHTRLVEVVDPSQHACGAGATGRVLVTMFGNDVWPYVRYEMGDEAALMAREPCSCGRTLPKLGSIVGRTGDLVRTPDGRVATVPNFNNLFSLVAGAVTLYQVRQERLSDVEVQMVVTEQFNDEVERFLLESLTSFLGEQIDIQFRFVDDVPVTAIGKRRLIVSTMEEEQREIEPRAA